MGAPLCKAACRRLPEEGDAVDALRGARDRAARDAGGIAAERVSAAASAALEDLLRLGELEEHRFSPARPLGDIQVWRLDAPPTLRACVDFPLCADAGRAVSAVLDYAIRSRWDDLFSYGEVLQALDTSDPSESLSIAWEATQMPSGEAGRDFVLARLAKRLKDGRVAAIVTSLDAPNNKWGLSAELPAHLQEGALLPDHVRAYAHLMGFVAKEKPDGGTSLTFICQLDLGGVLPASVTDDFMLAQARRLSALRDLFVADHVEDDSASEAKCLTALLGSARAKDTPENLSPRLSHNGVAACMDATQDEVDKLQDIKQLCSTKPADVVEAFTLLGRFDGPEAVGRGPVACANLVKDVILDCPGDPHESALASLKSSTRLNHSTEATQAMDVGGKAGWTETGLTPSKAKRSVTEPAGGPCRWRAAAATRTKRSNFAAAVAGGRLFICGGTDQPSQRLETVEVLDASTLLWQRGPSMRTQRSAMGAATLGESIYVCGGWSSRSKLSSVEYLDTHLGFWNSTISMQTERCALAVASLNGALYACGGFDEFRNLSSMERFDPREHNWTYVAPMHTRRFAFALSALNDKLYACGGSDGLRHLASVECYDPRMDAWHPVAPMSMPRSGLATTDFEGCLYACGGRSLCQTLAAVERFDPYTCGWSNVSPMTTERCGLVVATLGCRMYACAGGSTSVEHYGRFS